MSSSNNNRKKNYLSKTPKKGTKRPNRDRSNNYRRNKTNSPKQSDGTRRHNNSSTNEPRLKFASFDDILKGISIKPHNGCHANSCWGIYCDLVRSKQQSSFVRLSIHLSGSALTDDQLSKLTKEKLIPLITNHIKSQKEKIINDDYFDESTLGRVVISVYLNGNFLFGKGCLELIKFIKEEKYRILTFQLLQNAINDDGCNKIMNEFKKIKYPPNELHLSNNKITNIGFNSIVDMIKHKNYPIRPYRIRNEVAVQNKAPLWLRIDRNQINYDAAKEYMKKNDISFCEALNASKRNKIKTGQQNYRNDKGYKLIQCCCDTSFCIPYDIVNHYENGLKIYSETLKDEKNKRKYMNHLNSRCKTCAKSRKLNNLKHKRKKIHLCKKCREKAKLLDKQQKQKQKQISTEQQLKKSQMDNKLKKMTKKDEQEEEDLVAFKINDIMNDKTLGLHEKIEAMEQLAKEQDKVNIEKEKEFDQTIVKPWIWGDDDNDDNNQDNDNNDNQDEEEEEEDDKYDDDDIDGESDIENEFWQEPFCKLPPNFKIPMIHLSKFNEQIKEAANNDKIAMAAKLLNVNGNNDDNNEKDEKTVDIEEKKQEIKTINNNSLSISEQKIQSNLPIKQGNNIKFDAMDGNIRNQYEENLLKNSETPLFIMCDTCSILRMVALQKKSAMNYWETMLTHHQKIEYIVDFTIKYTLKTGKFLTNSESYQRRLRMEILPKIQLHLNTEEIKWIGNRLSKIQFKKLQQEKKKSKKKYETYFNKYKDIITVQIYRFVALHPDKVPSKESDKHIWQEIIQKYIFNDCGYECPQELIPKFITETKKLSRQYQQQKKLEDAKTFTLNTLCDKADDKEFGFNINSKSEQCCILIPHTVTRELEHIKTTRANKSKGDLWRVQRLCGSGGLLETLCKKCGCDILGSEHGEAHLEFRHGNNDYTIISVAEHYSKLLNNENNLGFVLLTNDKAMYTIASGKGIPVVSLNSLNSNLQKDQIENNNNKSPSWNASYLRKMFLLSGFVGGFAKKHLVNDAINILGNNTVNLENIKDSTKLDDTIINELKYRRQQVVNLCIMQQQYVIELFNSMGLTNDLIITLKDILQNRDSADKMKEMYQNKVQTLEFIVRQSQARWSQYIQLVQGGGNSDNNNNNNNNDNDEEKKKQEQVIIKKNKKPEIYFDDDIPEINRFHADDMDKVHGNYVDVYDINGDRKIKKRYTTQDAINILEQGNNNNNNDEIKNNNDEIKNNGKLEKIVEDIEDGDDDSDDMPPPLDEADQKKLLEIQQTLNNMNNGDIVNKDDNKVMISVPSLKETAGGSNDDNDNNKDEENKDQEEDKNEEDKNGDVKIEKWNQNVPLIGGYLAGEELFDRQANAAGYEEEVVIMS